PTTQTAAPVSLSGRRPTAKVGYAWGPSGASAAISSAPDPGSSSMGYAFLVETYETERLKVMSAVLVGDEIVRHNLTARVHPWTVALLFLLCLFTGLPIWMPVFGWMANLVGGLHVARWLHPWAGVLLSAAMLWMF